MLPFSFAVRLPCFALHTFTRILSKICEPWHQTTFIRSFSFKKWKWSWIKIQKNRMWKRIWVYFTFAKKHASETNNNRLWKGSQFQYFWGGSKKVSNFNMHVLRVRISLKSHLWNHCWLANVVKRVIIFGLLRSVIWACFFFFFSRSVGRVFFFFFFFK